MPPLICIMLCIIMQSPLCFSIFNLGGDLLPYSNYGMAIGYDKRNKSVLLLGGDDSSTNPKNAYIYKNRHFVTFDGTTFTDKGLNYFDLHPIENNNQYSTQIRDTLWIIQHEGYGLLTFDTTTYETEDPLIAIPTGVRSSACLTSTDNYLFVVGGGYSIGLDLVQIYDLNASEWIAGVPSLDTPRFEPACAIVADTLYAIAGYTNRPLSTIEVLDVSDASILSSNTWNYFGDTLQEARYGLTASVYHQTIYAVGGIVGGPLLGEVRPTGTTAVDIIDTAAGLCSVADDLYFPIARAPCIIVANTLFSFGGFQYLNNTVFEDNRYQYLQLPTTNPSAEPTDHPTRLTQAPSASPTKHPSREPSFNPSASSFNPSGAPSFNPSGAPSFDPSGAPSFNPSGAPHLNTTVFPSEAAINFTVAIQITGCSDKNCDFNKTNTDTDNVEVDKNVNKIPGWIMFGLPAFVAAVLCILIVLLYIYWPQASHLRKKDLNVDNAHNMNKTQAMQKKDRKGDLHSERPPDFVIPRADIIANDVEIANIAGIVLQPIDPQVSYAPGLNEEYAAENAAEEGHGDNDNHSSDLWADSNLQNRVTTRRKQAAEKEEDEVSDADAEELYDNEGIKRIEEMDTRTKQTPLTPETKGGSQRDTNHIEPANVADDSASSDSLYDDQATTGAIDPQSMQNVINFMKNAHECDVEEALETTKGK